MRHVPTSSSCSGNVVFEGDSCIPLHAFSVCLRINGSGRHTAMVASCGAARLISSFLAAS
jgi:hypothetical protein